MSPPSVTPNQRTPSPSSQAREVLSAPQRLGPALDVGGGRLRVRVGVALFVVAAAPGIAGGAGRMACYAALVFLTLIVHELGHALCALAFGSRALITLHVLGGHTAIEPRLSRGRDVIAMLLGPVASIAFGSLLVAVRSHIPEHQGLDLAAYVSLAWGVVNLLPVLPFDGGRVLLTLVGEKHRSSALLISGALAAVIAVEGLLVLHSPVLIFLFGAAALSSLLGWAKQRRAEIEHHLGLPEQLERARTLLSEAEPERARELATRVGVRAHSNATANSAWELVAWAELDLGSVEDAYSTLSRIRPTASIPCHALAAIEVARGKPRNAITLLESARASGELSVGATKLLIDLYVRAEALDRACDVASGALSVLDAQDTRRVIETAFEANAFAPATTLAGELFAITASPDDAVSQAYGLARLGHRSSARRIFRELVAVLSNWQMHKETLARLRDLAMRPDLREIIGPELSQLALAPAPA
jgi:Zn-dependent protease